MGVATREAGNCTGMPTSMLRDLLHVVRMAIESHAEYRVKSAVPPAKLQQSDREIRRCRCLMQAGK